MIHTLIFLSCLAIMFSFAAWSMHRHFKLDRQVTGLKVLVNKGIGEIGALEHEAEQKAERFDLMSQLVETTQEDLGNHKRRVDKLLARLSSKDAEARAHERTRVQLQQHNGRLIGELDIATAALDLRKDELFHLAGKVDTLTAHVEVIITDRDKLKCDLATAWADENIRREPLITERNKLKNTVRLQDDKICSLLTQLDAEAALRGSMASALAEIRDQAVDGLKIEVGIDD